MPNLKANTKNIFRIFAENPNKFALLILFCFALILRIHHLDNESLWMDEIRQTSFYSHTLLDIVYDAATTHQPPLDYWIGHFIHFISTEDFAARLPAAIFGAGSVVMLAVLISQFCSWPVGIGFGIVFALLPFNLYYSQEARPYAIVVFLFLCMFWRLNRFLSIDKKKNLLPFLTLLFFVTIFLYSRSLSPLTLTVSLLLILITWLFVLFLKADATSAQIKRRLMVACGAFFLALVFSLPSLKIILAKSARYVPDTSLGLNLDSLLSVISKFDIAPIWQAYVVQSEPITYPLLLLVSLSPYFGWQLHLHRKNSIWGITTLLLPVSCMLNLFIFQSKSNMPFRPSYVSYLLPLVCILGAVSVHGIWTLSAKARFVLTARRVALILAVLLIFQTLMSAIGYKTMNRKSDWRGLCAYLAKNYETRHLLIFDSFSPYGSWEPTFYGFPRYYHGHSPIVSVGQIPPHASTMATLALTPIFILFQWREYYLTPQSAYPILSFPSPDLSSIDYKKICRDPGLICTEFTGFSAIQLRAKTYNLARDTYDIIEKLLLHSPEGSWNAELHLAAAALGRAIQVDQWRNHLMQAERMVHDKQLQEVNEISEYIRLINPP
jgi:4-amino-4-deoxy-L-arabinose transferase-like glycosyltransferase